MDFTCIQNFKKKTVDCAGRPRCHFWGPQQMEGRLAGMVKPDYCMHYADCDMLTFVLTRAAQSHKEVLSRWNEEVSAAIWNAMVFFATSKTAWCSSGDCLAEQSFLKIRGHSDPQMLIHPPKKHTELVMCRSLTACFPTRPPPRWKRRRSQSQTFLWQERSEPIFNGNASLHNVNQLPSSLGIAWMDPISFWQLDWKVWGVVIWQLRDGWLEALLCAF